VLFTHDPLLKEIVPPQEVNLVILLFLLFGLFTFSLYIFNFYLYFRILELLRFLY